LFEEAMRRYQVKYNVVGGFSFYERAEVKDMISYLKAIQNPDDSIAIQRVINTPTRGIGKTTMETIERVALETGLSLWGAINEALRRDLLQPRALAALKAFRDLIEDARAMYLGTMQERLAATAAAENSSRYAGDAGKQDDEEDLQHAMDFSPEMFADDSAASDAVAAAEFAPEMFGEEAADSSPSEEATPSAQEAVEGFRTPGEAASTAELLKFLLDRTGYIRQLEQEDTPETLARIENLRELVNAAMDSRARGETLNEFLDHAALVSDADDYDENSRVTLMTLHAAKGLEFPLVLLVGMEEGLFPHSRTLLAPDDMEEERRLAYVGMTRAMDTLILTRARYRRRYGTDMPEASVASRFLEEVPSELIQDLGGQRRTPYIDRGEHGNSTHYSYEDEDQRPQYPRAGKPQRAPMKAPAYNSIDNIAEFFASRGKKFTRPKVDVPQPTGRTGFHPGQRVRHPKYGEGTVYKREGDGEEAKITVQFPRFGVKKLVEKYAQLEKA
jgi:DNA helicase-2/ATP-dependent DNA helicase PcrA